MPVILDPDTPGGFNPSMAWRPVSKSATADAMIAESARSTRYVMILSKVCVNTTATERLDRSTMADPNFGSLGEYVGS
jgi:hypothetical protein